MRQNRPEKPEDQQPAASGEKPSPITLYVGLLTLYCMAIWGFLAWFEIFENRLDSHYDTAFAVIIDGAHAGVAGLVLTVLTVAAVNLIKRVAAHFAKRSHEG